MPYLKQVIDRLNEIKDVLIEEQNRIQTAIDFVDRCIAMNNVEAMVRSIEDTIDDSGAASGNAIHVARQSLEQEIEKYVAKANEANCLYCGKAFTPTVRQGGNPQKFCSTACGRNYRKRLNTVDKVVKERGGVKCVVCGKDLEYTTTKQGRMPKYCSKSCQHKEYYQRKKQSWVEEPAPKPADPLREKLAEIAATHPKPMQRPNLTRDI